MSITEQLLRDAGGNKYKAGVALVIGLMRGDPETFKLGYSFGSALMTAIEQYNLTVREIAIVAERVAEEIAVHHSATRRPLVIVHVGGGLIQWTHAKPGLGTPRVHELDFDREGASEAELRQFLDQIDGALEALAEYRDDADHDVMYTLGLARNQYQDHIDEGTQPSRYR